ncbi:MAG: aminotransferase class III-fold pyridoxal phosphate-dependent enzyme, partial [Pseudomonadota bacterium]
ETTGPHLAKALESLSDHPLVGEVRGVGMLGALELVSEPGSRNRFDNKGTAGTVCRDCALENGLILRATGDTMLLSPPLTISCEQIDEVAAKARVALDAAADKLRDHFK